MNRILLLIAAATAALLTTANTPATSTDGNDLTEDQLRQVIEHRADSLYNLDKKPDENIKLKHGEVRVFIDNGRKLINILDDRLNDVNAKNERLNYIKKAYQKLLTADATIFTDELPEPSTIPQCLKPHYDTVKAVRELLTETSALQKDIDNQSAHAAAWYSDKSEQELIPMVAEKIEQSVLDLGNHIVEFQKGNHPSLSQTQEEYFEKNVKDKYNAIVRKYFPTDE